MRPNLRRSFASKVVAISFIALILLGNYWVVLALTGSPLPGWLYDAGVLSTAGVLAGGIGLLVTAIINPGHTMPGDDE